MINNTFNFLSNDECEALHQATLKVLKDPGVMVVDAESRKIFKDNGCEVDEASHIVKIPEHLVEEAIKTAPSEISLYARDKDKDLNIKWDGDTHWINFATGVKVCDYMGSGNYVTRDSTEQDLRNIAKVCDWAENIDYFMNAVVPNDLTGLADTDMHKSMIAFTDQSKPTQVTGVWDDVAIYHEITKTYYGGDEELAYKRPLFGMSVCPTSPLELGENVCKSLLEGGKYNVPAVIISMAMAGGSSPVHLAGTIVTHNAEVLSSIVLSQLANPGAPVIYASSTTTFDLKTGTAPVGSPEISMLSAAIAQLSRYYKLPSYVAGS